MTTKEKFEEAVKNAKINDCESMKYLFNYAAEMYYLKHTPKSFEELNEEGRLSYSPNWDANIFGTEFDSVEDCIDAAQNEATFALEREMEDAE